ncbi:MAG: SDR family NAD(P)-dependent oxidoreductase [Christensenellales bacterium]|jgi:NAD(P)-dependent dehydrogenase (short-subunit alcohol dehydrogenase family)
MHLNNKIIMITGAGSGIGKATAKVCAKYGAAIAAVDINEEAAVNTAEEIMAEGGIATAFYADVTKRDTVKFAVDAIYNMYIRIDCLFNNAGVCIPQNLINMSDEDLMHTFDVNVKGAFIVATEVSKVMIPMKKGRIVNTASIASYHGEYGNAAYCMSKAAAAMMTQVMAMEWAEYGITAVAISPGNIKTEMLHKAFVKRAESEGKSVKTYYDEAAGRIILKRLGEPTEIAEFVAWLFDDRSEYIDGNNMLIAGGLVMS